MSIQNNQTTIQLLESINMIAQKAMQAEQSGANGDDFEGAIEAVASNVVGYKSQGVNTALEAGSYVLAAKLLQRQVENNINDDASPAA